MTRYVHHCVHDPGASAGNLVRRRADGGPTRAPRSRNRFWLALASALVAIACGESSVSVELGCEGVGRDADAECVGALDASVEGLPQGIAASIRVTGPGGFDATLTSSGSLEGLAPGSYSVSVGNVTADPATPTGGALPAPNGPQRTWRPRDRSLTFPVKKGERAALKVQYDLISMIVLIEGLPVGVPGAVTVRGPSGYGTDLTATDSLSGLAQGTYHVTGLAVTAPDQMFMAVPFDQEVDLVTGETSTAEATYTAVTGVRVSPQDLALAPGETTTLQASATLADGSERAVVVAWAADGGSISDEGVFVAGTSEGTFDIVGTLSSSVADTASVTIERPAPTVTGISVAPAQVELVAGEAQQFTASAQMSDGSVVPATVTWSAGGGTITQDGAYASGTQPGVYTVTATHGAGLAGSATVTVVAPPPAQVVDVRVSPDTASVEAGAQRTFSAVVEWSDGSTTNGVSWSATGGTIGVNGRYTAGGSPGTYRVIGRHTASGQADTSAVTVVAAPAQVVDVRVSPDTVTLEDGAQHTFSAVVEWSDGSTTSGVSWSATGGAIALDGGYTAGVDAGTYEVIGRHTASGQADTSAVTIAPATPQVVAVSATPATASLAPAGQQQFAASLQWSDGSTTTGGVTWTTNGGSVTAQGLYTAPGSGGTYRVVATHGASQKADTSTVTVSEPPQVVAVDVSPPTASLLTGVQQQFSAALTWSDGSTTSGGVTWTANGGSITAQGLFTAPLTAGSFRVIGTHGGSQKADTSLVTVTTPLPLPSGRPDPALLPVATTAQWPLKAAYNALNVPSIPVGGFYQDPSTGVRVYRLTSGSFPSSSPRWGHDYSEGGNEVSLPRAGGTRSVIVRENGGPYWLIDFTPGVGVSNARRLPGSLSPTNETAFTFSSNPATPQYAFVATGYQVVRFDIVTMTAAPGNGWPVSDDANTWLHQSYDDHLFTWLRGDQRTAVGYEPSTGTKKTWTGSVNEPRIDRGGRYIGLVMDSPNSALYVWDWQTNQITWQTTGTPPFGHNASLRRLWIGVDVYGNYPPDFTAWRPDVPGSTEYFGGPANASAFYGNGNWNQPNVPVFDQWALMSNYGGVDPISGDWDWLAPGGMIYITRNGERRLLGHPYNSQSNYTWYSFVKQSPDGEYVLFTSDMNGSSRSDVFLVEVPRR